MARVLFLISIAGRSLIFALLAMINVATPATAQSLEDELRYTWQVADAAADLVLPPPAGVWSLEGNELDYEIVEAPIPGGEALKLSVSSRTANGWDVFAAAYNTVDIKAGDTIFVSLWAKSEKPPRGREHSVLPAVLLQENGGNYADFGTWSADLNEDWQRYYFHGVAPKDYKAGSFGVVIHLGRFKQKLALGPVYVLNLGPDFDRSTLPAPPSPAD